MKAKSIKGESFQQIKSSIEDCLLDGFKPTLALVFSPVPEDRDPLCSLLTNHDISIFGVSSYGEFIDEDYEGLSISILLLDLDKDYFKVELRDYKDGQVNQAATEIGAAGKEAFINPTFIISGSDTSSSPNEIIAGIEEIAGNNISIIGGNAAAKDLDYGNHVFDGKKASFSGMIALILDEDKVQVTGEAISGWKAAGTPKVVTKSEGNWVYTLDDKPALDIFLKFMGTDLNPDENEDLFNKAGNTFPLQITDEDGDKFMRAPLLFNFEERSFMCAGLVPQGSTARFSMPPDFTVGEEVIKSSHFAKESIMPSADAVVVFSCLGRLTCLGPMITLEIEGLLRTWNVPMIGFFTFGEFGRVNKGKNMFHNTTVSWVALKEKE
jgi:hypothetical protein